MQALGQRSARCGGGGGRRQATARHAAAHSRPACGFARYAAGAASSGQVSSFVSDPCPAHAAPLPRGALALSGGPARRSRVVAVAAQAPAAGEQLTPEAAMSRAAADLQGFCEALPELTEEVLSMLANGNPRVMSTPPAEVRSKLEAMASALGLPFVTAAKLSARVPDAWGRPPEALVAKLQPLAGALGVALGQAAELMIAQPALWAINQPTIIKDKLETLAGRLGVAIPAAVVLVGRQPLLWVVQPETIANSLEQLSQRLGLSAAAASDLAVRMPVVLVLEPRLLALNVTALCATSGLTEGRVLDLLARCLGLAAVPAELVASSLEGLAADLEVSLEDVVDLLLRQPMALCAPLSALRAGADTLRTVLGCDQAAALRCLAAQPGLLYDFGPEVAGERMEALAATLSVSQDEARALALAQPALLAISPATARSTLSALGLRTGAALADCTEVFADDPGSFVLMGFQGDVVGAWAERLGLGEEEVVALVAAQPGLLEVTANSVKARLESLSALFQVPSVIAGQLALKHAALLAIPPNATITRVKNLSTALKLSMATAGALMAKEPLVLGLAAHNAAGLRGAVADAMAESAAMYEYYTMDWLQRQVREAQPARLRSFSSLHR